MQDKIHVIKAGDLIYIINKSKLFWSQISIFHAAAAVGVIRLTCLFIAGCHYLSQFRLFQQPHREFLLA